VGGHNLGRNMPPILRDAVAFIQENADADIGLEDIAAAVNVSPRSVQYAFRRNLGLRIDHMWITDPLVPRSVKSWIDIEPRRWERPSDHAPVIAEFS